MKKPRLNIITPCSRDYNLQTLYDSITEANAQGHFEILWIIIIDKAKLKKTEHLRLPISFAEGAPTVLIGVGTDGEIGNRLKNQAIELIESGWVMFLDDDNTVHPEMLDTFWYHTAKYKNAQAFIFATAIGPDGREYVKTRMDGIAPGHIDTAQFIVSRHLIGEVRWDPCAYDADGIFITEIYKRRKETFVLIDGIVYYNALSSKSCKHS
jgi:hypothetical protein